MAEIKLFNDNCIKAMEKIERKVQKNESERKNLCDILRRRRLSA